MDNLEITLRYGAKGKVLRFERDGQAVDVDTHEITKGQFNDLVQETKARMAPGRPGKAWKELQR